MVETWIESGVSIKDSNINRCSSWIRRETIIRDSSIGRDVFIGFRCTLSWTIIGDGTQLAARVQSAGTEKHSVVIQPYCWLGGGVEIKPGVVIGEGSVIGAGSLVEEDIQPYSIAVGRPARIIRKREIVYDNTPCFADFLAYIRQRDEALEKTSRTGSFLNADIGGSQKYTFGDNVIMVGKRDSSGRGGISLGDSVKIGSGAILEGIGGITIGDRTIIDDGVMLFTTTHDYKRWSLPQLRQPIIIGSDVFIGANAIVLAGVTIGDNAYVEPGALVNKDVLPRQYVKRKE